MEPPPGPGLIQAVVFDIGGVLLGWDPQVVYRELIPDDGKRARFLGEICTLEWHAQHDRGVPFALAAAALAAEHPDQAELIWAWGRRSEEMITGPIEGTVQILRELQGAGVATYALTNMEAETYPRRRERFPFLQSFLGTVVSSAEGVIKPEPEIFRRLTDRYGLVPERTLLIDDAPRNVAAARGLGWDAIRFESPVQLRSELRRRGLLAQS